MSEGRRVLVVDDEESLRHMISLVLGRAGYRVALAPDGEAALALLQREDDVSLVLCDVRMPRLDGLGFLARVRGLERPVWTVVMSAYGSVDLALEAVRAGAADYLSKPFKPDEILLALRKVEERERLALENARLRAALRHQGGLEGLVGSSPAMGRLADAVRKVAAYPTTVLITGESGTGKERLARALHSLSARADALFVAVNCGAIPETLLETELFGHVRGAFTGAVRDREGLFEQADKGTLLLDEIGELPPTLQVKLLRVLQEQALRRVGGTRDLKVDVRVVAATSRDLSAEVAAGRFREDLLYRLDVVHLRVPPLRERPSDIPELVAWFLERHNKRLGKRVTAVDEAAMRRLVRHSWPGNVRQLENVLERAVLLAEGNTLGEGDLELPDTAGKASSDSEDLSIKRRTADLERELIQRALERTGGNRTHAARLLDISYKALVYKVREYGLEP